jgi:transcriptional regulator GlxA family with amidase domain
MESADRQRTLGVLVFHGFELLDVFGPLEAFGVRPVRGYFDPVLVAQQAGPVESAQGPRAFADAALTDPRPFDMILVPGGFGTRKGVDNLLLGAWIAERAAKAEIVMSVCTGAAMLARAGVLEGRRATTNKLSFQWATSQGPNVRWVKEARWVEDGNVFTSSGVSAGIDMALAVIAKLLGTELAEEAALHMEYEWVRDADWDPFAKINGLV